MADAEVFAAAEELVRQAMGSGVACFADRVAAGQIDMTAPLTEAFGDFPAEFLRIRPQLLDRIVEAIHHG
jgi:hypothetical protein